MGDSSYKNRRPFHILVFDKSSHFPKELKESFLYRGNILWFFFLYKGKCCIFAPRLT